MRRLSVGFALAAVAIFALIGAALATAAGLGEGEAVEAGAPATKEATPVCTEATAEAEVETETQAEAAACPGEEVEAEEEVSAGAEATAEQKAEAERDPEPEQVKPVKRGSTLGETGLEAAQEVGSESESSASRPSKKAEAKSAKAKQQQKNSKTAAEDSSGGTTAESTRTETSGALSSLDLGDGSSTLEEELEVPTALLPVYEACGSRYGISWEVLAAINKVETGFGTNLGTSGAGAEGWMQFLPQSWEEWGIDADGDGTADTDDPVDAICSAARYLAASGGESDIYDAVLAYNHADWYAREVLTLARQYERVPANLVNSLTELAAGSTSPVAGATSSWNRGAAAESLSSGWASEAVISSDEGGESEEGAAAEGDSTATIAAAKGAVVRAVVAGTVAEAGEDGARGHYVVLTDPYGDRIVYSDLGSTAVEQGDEVDAGDEVGKVGDGSIGFRVQPDASTAIDPGELLEIWQEGGVGKIYGVDAADATDGSKAIRALLMSSAALQREVLADSDLELPRCVRTAVAAGRLQRQTLAALEYLTASGHRLGVATSTCEHDAGFFVALDSVDGEATADGQGSGTAAYALVHDVLAMDAASAPQTVASATGLAAGETGGTTTTIALDYRPPSKARIVDGDAIAPTDAPAAVQAMIAAANQIDETPYVWGGGHGAWVADGYDCSGSVSYVLHAARMLASPQVSGALAGWGETGTGNWVTVYANAEHTYAVIAGLRWDTVGDASGTGPRWHTGAAYPEGFSVRHPAGL